MKKLITIFIICCLTLALVFSMASCGDNKDNKETQATQDTQSTDNNENTESEQNKETTCSHTWVDADCDTPKTCSICGATEGDALGHATEEDDGNCLTPIVCPRCNEVLTSGKTQHIAHADDGDCTTPIDCTICGTIITSATDGHSAEPDDHDCTTPTKCVTCEKVLVEAKAHTPAKDDGNCMTEIKCTECGKTAVAEATDHNDTDHDYICDNGDCQITLDGAPKDENEGIDFPIVPN